MQSQLFPKETIEHSVEAYLPTVSVRSQLIYTALLLFIIVLFLLLPFIYVDVSVQAKGVIRPVAEKTEIKSLVSGKIGEINVSENKYVVKGETLLIITSEELDNKLQIADFQVREQAMRLKDLRELVRLSKNNLLSIGQMNSALYAQQFSLFKSAIQENNYARQKVERELVTDRKLYDEKIIAKRELEAKEYELIKLDAELETLFQRQKGQWQADLNQLTLESERLQNEQKQVNQQKVFYEIKAPLNGNIQELTSKYKGSLVQAGEQLMIISPDSSLLVECYINPQDMGLIKKGMMVNFQIDALNYNEWGLVKGKVVDVATDFSIINNQPVFKVKCDLQQHYLQLPTGYKANLSKGMTLTGRFWVTKRNLYQLLYDKIDDWLNPKVMPVQVK